ncbi:MAG: hypothetical protein Q7U53_13965 [Anaerolineaceae bacterium]|nr:hypothetical protein [Anaerolineaceae bacterium]
MIHRLGEDGNFADGWIGERKDRRAHNQHGRSGSAHDDEHALKGFATLLFWRAIKSSHQVGKDLNTGHHRQNAHKAPDGEVQIGRGKGFEGKHRQMKPRANYRGKDHNPEQN